MLLKKPTPSNKKKKNKSQSICGFTVLDMNYLLCTSCFKCLVQVLVNSLFCVVLDNILFEFGTWFCIQFSKP